MTTFAVSAEAPAFRRLVVAALVAVLVALALNSSLDATRPTASPVAKSTKSSEHAGLSDVPLAAQGPVSRALGRDDRAYWLHGLTAENQAQHLTASFSAAGVTVTSGRAHERFSLTGFGPALPQASANRVSFARRGVDEWYANGPAGLEQGFDLARRPSGTGDRLNLTLNLAGNLRPSVAGGSVLLSGAGASLRYTGLIAIDARGHRLAASLALRGQRLTISVDDRGAVFPVRVDPVVQQDELTASDGAGTSAANPMGDNFGDTVAISGNTIAIGAPGHAVGATQTAGAVYVFVEPSTGWTTAVQTAELTVAGAGGIRLGGAVAISGDTIAAGAAQTNGAAGAVYVFTKPATGWATTGTPLAQLSSSDSAANDELGVTVAIAGNTIVTGSPSHAAGATTGRGAVYVYTEPTGGWATTTTPNAELAAPTGGPDSSLGSSVAISADDDTIAAGNAGYGTGVNPYEGAVYVFTKPSGGWSNATTAAGVLTASDGANPDELGNSVAISADGDTVVGGALDKADGATMSGAGYVWVKPSSGWASNTQNAELTPSDGSFYVGSSVAISGTTVYLLSGAQLTVYAYTEPSTGWADASQPATVTTAAVSGDGGRSDVAATGGTLLVGSGVDTVGSGTTRQGSAYVFGGGPGSGPTVTGVSPATGGATTGGTAVTITGTGFTGAISVTFGGQPATAFSVVSPTQITATAPPGAAGTVDVVVTTDDGASPTVTADQFTYGSGGAGGTGGGGGGAKAPVNSAAPVIHGTPKAGAKETCSTGTWTNQPTKYLYQWSRSGTPIQGATKSTYTVQRSDEQLTLTCAVTASNATGSGGPVTSKGVKVPVPKVAKCPAATGSLSATKLGLVKLGMTRTAARHAYTKSSNHGRKYADFFCLTPIGVRVGYGSPAVAKSLRDKVIWASTSSAYYTVKRIRVGATVAAAAKLVKLAGPFKVGANTWYFARNGASNAIFKVRRGVIEEIGIATKALTIGKKAELKFLKSFS